MPAEAIRVHGFRDLNRAFARAEKRLGKDLRDSLREAAEPVREDAETLAASEITNVEPGDPWSLMRVGVTQRVVYVAPRKRGTSGRANDRRRRPKFGDRLAEQMEDALERNRAGVVRQVEETLVRLERDWGRG